MNTLLSYKQIPFNVGDGYILVNGEDKLEVIEALLVAKEIDNLRGRFDVLLINDPNNFLNNYYKPVQNSPEEEAKIITDSPVVDDLKSSGVFLRDIYEGYKMMSPIYKNALGYERDINSRIEMLLLRNLGLKTEFVVELAERSEEKGVLFWKNKVVNQLKEFLLYFDESPRKVEFQKDERRLGPVIGYDFSKDYIVGIS